jgi:hypothetical protein
MQITVTDLDIASARPMGNMRAPGYRVHFTCSLVSGSALFVPACAASDKLKGETFDVEISQEAIEKFASVPPAVPHESRLTALARGGDFEVVGIITSIVRLGDALTTDILTITAADASFTLDSNEVGSSYRDGEWVTFIAREVSLWDEAI